MKFTSAGLALLLALASTGSFAVTTWTGSKTFSYIDPTQDVVLPLGFGRAGDRAIDTGIDKAAGISALRQQGSPDAVTFGSLPFTFHDIWTFNGLKAGSYSFDTLIAATGTTGFGLVMLEWYSQGTQSSMTFDISGDYRTAHAAGTVTLDASCQLNYCMSLHLFGWQDSTADRGYNGLINVSAVPEPATAVLWLAGLVGLGALSRRRRPS